MEPQQQGEIQRPARRRAVVHRVPDLDAVASVVAAGIDPDDVLFMPTNIAAIPESMQDARVLDHPCGRPHREGRRSVLWGMPEAEGWDPAILAEVEDVTCRRDTSPRFSLGDILAALRTEAIFSGLTGRALDRSVVRRMGRVIRGLQANHEAIQTADVALQDVPALDLGNGCRLAILGEDNRLHMAGRVLAGRGFAGSVWRRNNGLGVSRNVGFPAPDLTLLRAHLPGWYVPDSGLVACWGSAKAPVGGPPPAGTPQTVSELMDLLVRVFQGQSR